jgi:hypothetical protein
MKRSCLGATKARLDLSIRVRLSYSMSHDDNVVFAGSPRLQDLACRCGVSGDVKPKSGPGASRTNCARTDSEVALQKAAFSKPAPQRKTSASPDPDRAMNGPHADEMQMQVGNAASELTAGHNAPSILSLLMYRFQLTARGSTYG